MSKQLITIYERLFREIEKGCGDFEGASKIKAGSLLLEQFCVQEEVIASCPKTERIIDSFLTHLIGRQIGFLVCNGDYYVDFSDSGNWHNAMDEIFTEHELLLISFDLRLSDETICLDSITSVLASLYHKLNTTCRKNLAKIITFKGWQSIVPTFECFFAGLSQKEANEAFQFILEREFLIVKE